MEIPFPIMLVLLGLIVASILALWVYNSDKRISTKTEQFDIGQDNKKFLEMASATTISSEYEQDIISLWSKYEQEHETLASVYASGTRYLLGGAYYPVLSPSSGVTIMAQHCAYPETLKPAQTHCQFCGNLFVPDKFGRCSSCGGPSK